MFQCRNLTKKFGTKAVIDRVSFSLEPGEIAVLLGASGVGKSTLLRLLNDLEGYEGEILLNNRRAGKTDIGMVFQDYFLFDHLNSLDNIALPLKLSLKQREIDAYNHAKALLNQFGLHDLSLSYPHQLSGGQKQRLAIARAMALKPALLCMDEPTSALDPVTSMQALEEIRKLSSRGMIVLMTTHDTSIVEKIECTVFLMDRGKIVESGKSQNLEDSPKIRSYCFGHLNH